MAPLKKSDIFVHVPYKILLDNLDKLCKLNINCEIYVSGESLDTHTPAEINRINSTFQELKLKKIMHGPFMDLNAGSFDSSVREITGLRLLKALDFCQELGSENIVLHTGFHPIFYAHHKERWLNFACDTFKPAVEKAARQKINICIENSIDTSPDVIVELIEKINAPNFSACFDVAHYNVFTKIPILECLKKYDPKKIREIHLSDNNGERDSHLALGEGKIDFPSFFHEVKKLRIEPIITVEPHTVEDIPKSIAYLEKVISD